MTDPISLTYSAGWIWKILAKLPVITRWFVRWQYPSAKCRESLLLDLDGNQARFELLDQRPSHSLTCLGFRAHNHLPFDVSVELHRVKAYVGSYQLLDSVLNTLVDVPSAASVQSPLPEISLSEQQRKWVRQLGRDCTSIRLEIHCHCKSSIQNWEDCRSFVFLSSINVDQSSH